MQRLWAVIVAFQLMAGGALAATPLPSPEIYASADKGLTFRSPSNSTYCPLPDDWMGSDHGTTIFLTPPDACGDVGYPSSGRAFSPETTPHISIYYGYWLEDFPPEPPCKSVGKAQLLGQQRSVCRIDGGKMRAVQAYSRYQADIPAEVYVTLVTTPARYDADVKIFEALLRSVKRCNSPGCAAKGEFF